ncbi:MAG: RpiB/LacA/LacB family sugar-phosphate isomerase [Patescibacteria group bacterium]|nr:RpiB/LacA/LacB family sugar-phosphate isomerase [Patescibacteria group bacterium]
MLYLGADHRGFKLKEELKKWLKEKEIEFVDLGNKVLDPLDDYVDFAQKVAKAVCREKNSCGVIICGSGVGVSIAANKIKGIRAGLVFNKNLAEQARGHDNINIMALPADFITREEALKSLETFLNTPALSEEKYQRRLKKVAALEQ